MTRWKKLFVLLEATAILFLFSGCWNYKEIEKNTIVAGVAIDPGTNGYKYHVTYETLSLTGGKDQTIKSSLLESNGNTIFDAVRQTVTMSDKKLYFSDCKVVIVSKEIAKEGIGPLLDFFLRDHEPRISLLFAVSDENTAAEILNIQLKTEEPVSYKISSMLEQSQDVLGQVLSYPLYQIYNVLTSQSQELTLPDIRVVKVFENKEPELGTNVIFRQDKMIGIMPENECLYYLMLKNQLKSGLLLTSVSPGQKDISLEIMKCSTKLQPVISGNHVTMKIQINIDADIGEENNQKDNYTAGNGEFRAIEKAASKEVQEQTESVINDIQKNYGTDIFGFGTEIHQNRYDDWKRLEPNWDKIFPTVTSEVSADVKLLNSSTALVKGGS